MRTSWLQFIICLSIIGCSTTKAGVGNGSSDLSPFDFGLSQAKTGEERYDVILRTHQAAVRQGVDVNYKGVKYVEIEVPEKAARIPLTRKNDFKGCTFVIKNVRKTVYLFESREKTKPINIPKSNIDRGEFRDIPQLAKGTHLLLIEDANPWVENRKGYSYGHQRRDILLIQDGIASNKVVMPYDNEQSEPICNYIDADDSSIEIKNLTINRTENSSAITNVFYITGKNGVIITNFILRTPENEKRNDRAIRIDDCTNVQFENVTIDGTYSSQEHSGYGISFDNVWNFYGNKIVGNANWGVFGTNNMNTTKIETSCINRFDIHCYGKDVSFFNVNFVNKYNQFASVYGDIVFDHCIFTSFDPIRNGGSYNSYVGHNVYFYDCVFNVTAKHNCLLRIGSLDNEHNMRKELTDKCWPNLFIKNLNVNLDESCSDVILLYTIVKDNDRTPSIGYISKIDIDGLYINSPTGKVRLLLTPKQITTKNEIEVKLLNTTLNGEYLKSTRKEVLKVNLPINGRIVFDEENGRVSSKKE